MTADTGALMLLLILWGGFFIGAYYVIRERRKETVKRDKWALDKAGRR
jgi:hypothetical protein